MRQTNGFEKSNPKLGNKKTNKFALIWCTLNKKGRFLIVLILILNLIQVSAMVVSPIIMKQMQNSFNPTLEDYGQSLLVKNCLIMFGVLVIWAVLALVGNYLSVLVDVLLMRSLQKTILSKTLSLTKADDGYFNQDKILTITTNDTLQIQEGIRALTRGLLIGIVYIIGGFIALVVLSQETYSVYITILAFMILVFGIEFVFVKSLRTNFRKMTKGNDAVIALTNDYTNGYRTIKTFLLQSFFLNDLVKQWKNYQKVSQKAFAILFTLIVVISQLSFIIQPIILLIMFYSNPKIANANVFPIFQAVNIFVLGIFITSGSLSLFLKTIINFNRVTQFLAYQPQISYTGQDKTETNDIVFDNVSFKFANQDSYALKNISFTLGHDQTLGIIGKTGSGKTVLLDLLTHQLQPTSGRIFVDKKNLKDIDINHWKQQYSLCESRPTLINDTIANNIYINQKTYDKQELVQNLKIAQAYDFVNNLEDKEQTIINTKGTNFSGGQKQRIALCRAISKKAPLLIIDDATSALDVLTEKAFMNDLKKLDSFQQKIIVSQRINNIKNCDHILVLDNGELISQGNNETLLNTCSFYKNIYETQIDRMVDDYE
ncbi:ABC transporter ATP-binding protein/permease [Ureaplasma miroungigenitalium]|uniref:ABC transporter ATP-binding protein/permease n=1 Tax=Ureaplasma miroungigenitalium TaxID=1042321 RepID=A0ABT3BMM0_9BACT|nr:ABC transporter ATP-binding protein [Ureaplasma miroungigenitalium]MCV3728500.1 ABC transporter ATP-binding protein/permease [Ureaplasma miroungigenitalium]